MFALRLVSGSEGLRSFALGSKGRFFPSRSLPLPRETPPPPWGKFLNGASPLDRGRAVSIPFPPSAAASEVQKSGSSGAKGEVGGGRGNAARPGRVPALPRTTDVFLPALGLRVPAPGVPASVCPGFRGRDYAAGAAAATRAAGAVTRRLAFFVDF